jgi:hypothetical protein
MQHKTVDRVPVMCQLALGHYFLNMRHRWKPHDIWFTSEAFADSLVTLCRRYRFDGILVNIPGRDPDWTEEVDSIEETQEGEVITWKDGLHTVVPWDDNPYFAKEDFALAPYPDFIEFNPVTDMKGLDHWLRYTWGVYHTPHLRGKAPGPLLEPPDYFCRTLDLVMEAVGDSVSVHGEVFSPFTHFLELFGYQDALVALALDPPKCETILERLSEATIAWGKAQAQRGVDAVLISSAFAGSGFISRRMYSQFVVPYERKVIDALHASFPDVPVYVHTCGSLGDRLELLADSHTDGIDTLDPPPLGDVKLADAKVRIGDKLFIKGNMNAVALLTDTREQVIERARKALEVGKQDGGYILSTACSVPPRVDPWKLEMLVDIAEAYGRD